MNWPLSVGVPLRVITLANQVAVTPAGSPVAVPMPVAPVVVCVIFVNTVLTHKVGAVEAALTVLIGFTVITPVALILPQPPINGIV